MNPVYFLIDSLNKLDIMRLSVLPRVPIHNVTICNTVSQYVTSYCNSVYRTCNNMLVQVTRCMGPGPALSTGRGQSITTYILGKLVRGGRRNVAYSLTLILEKGII